MFLTCGEEEDEVQDVMQEEHILDLEEIQRNLAHEKAKTNLAELRAAAIESVFDHPQMLDLVWGAAVL